jgi:Leucine-rich repeat (LRR) protein
VVKRLTELGASLTAPRLEALPVAVPVRPAEPSSPWADIDVTAPLPVAPRKPKARPAFAWRPSRWHWAGAVAVLVLLVLGPLGYYFGGTVIRFATNKGQVVIEVDDPNMEVTVRDNGAEIRDAIGRQVITLRAGEHVLDVTVKPGKFTPDEKFSKTFTLTRGDKEVIKVWEERGKAPQKPPGPDDRPQPKKEPAKPRTPATNEREAAEWVLSIGGTVTIWVAGRDKEIREKYNLPVPEQPFHVLKVRLAGNKQVNNAELENLKPLSNLTELNLSDTEISDDGLVHLQNLKNLTRLMLNKTKVGDKGLEYLKTLTNLQLLNLGETWVSNDGMKYLSSLTNLTQLSVDNTAVTDDGLVHLKSLTKLTLLWLYGTVVGNDGMAHLKPLTNLTELKLGGTRVGNTGLIQLKVLTNLTHLELGGTWVSNPGLQHVKPLANLKILYLNHIQVGDIGLEQLKPLTKLETLNLDGTQVTDKGLKHLHFMSRLRDLNLAGTKVTAEGAAELQQILPNCNIRDPQRTIAEYWLSHGGIVGIRTPDGEREIRAANDLPPTGVFHVVMLNLENNPHFRADGGELIGKVLTYLRVLKLNDTQVSDEGLKHLARLTNLQELDLRGTNVTAAGVAELRKALPNCKIITGPAGEPSADSQRRGAEWVLSIGGAVTIRTPGGEKEIKAVKELLPAGQFQVVKVNLQHNQQVTDAGLEHLKPLTNLTHLNLQFTQVSDAGLPHLHGLTGLKELDVDATKVTALGAIDLQAKLPNCRIRDQQRGTAEWVVPNGGTVGIRTADGVKEIRAINDLPPTGMLQLVMVDLENYRGFNDDGLKYLKPLSFLKVLKLNNTRVSYLGLKHLHGLANLQELDLRGTKVSAESVAELQKALPNCKIITGPDEPSADSQRRVAELVLSMGGAVVIRTTPGGDKMIRADKNLLPAGAFQVVAVDLQNIKQVTDEGMEHAKSLPHLTVFYLSGTPVSDEGLKRLHGLTNLRELDLRGTKVTAAGVAALRKALPRCKIYREGGSRK